MSISPDQPFKRFDQGVDIVHCTIHARWKEYPDVAIIAEWSHPTRAIKSRFHEDIRPFLDEYLPHYQATKDLGFISLVTGNHDIPRLALNIGPRELAIAYAFIFTVPGVPYYGDEIGIGS